MQEPALLYADLKELVRISDQNPSLEILSMGMLPEAHAHIQNKILYIMDIKDDIRRLAPRLKKLNFEVIHNIY